MDSKAWVARAMALALLVPAASACNKEDKTDESIEVQTEAPPPAAPMTIQIMPQGAGTVTGDLTATHETDKAVVRLNLTGLMDGKDYEAKIRYGDCAVAADFDGKDHPGMDNPPPAGTAPQPGMNEHKVGEKVTDIHLDQTGTTATGNADIDNDKLGADEAAYLVVTQDDVIVGCGDLRGHGDMGGMGAPAPTPAPGAMPADSVKK